MQSTSEVADGDVAGDLETAAAELADAEAAVEAVGERDAERVADAVQSSIRLLAKYSDSATGTGDFRAYVEFQDAVANHVEGLDEDLPRHDAFEAYESAVDDRRLDESDFEAAREALEPAEAVAERLDARAEAVANYREARRTVRNKLDDAESRLAERRRVAELGDADLDAPVELLREPIEAYDEAVDDAFATFRADASAREVLGLAATAAEHPLVDVQAPPEELLDYVESASVGEETVPTLLEYADYSRSKLSHYVESADELKRVVATRQTYLSRLSAEPLTVDWPPPEAVTLRRRAGEYESVVRRFADEDVVARCRAVRRLTYRDDYADLRRVATAHSELTDEQRRALAEGAIERDIEALEAEREQLQAALEEHPER